MDIAGIVKSTLFFLNDYVDSESKVKINELSSQVQIDLFVADVLELRFDLYFEQPKYKNVILKSCFFSTIIETSEVVLQGENKTEVRVPNPRNEFIIRYVEYHEYFEQRPDKIKHIEYIVNTYSAVVMPRNFEALHYYVAFPEEKLPKKRSAITYYRVLIIKGVSFFKDHGLLQTFKRIIKVVVK
jgi:hypothetical protein